MIVIYKGHTLLYVLAHRADALVHTVLSRATLGDGVPRAVGMLGFGSGDLLLGMRADRADLLAVALGGAIGTYLGHCSV